MQQISDMPSLMSQEVQHIQAEFLASEDKIEWQLSALKSKAVTGSIQAERDAAVQGVDVLGVGLDGAAERA